MILTTWRIVAERFTEGAFDGEGAARHPGRCNERGVPMVYTAATRSLAALEMLVHIGNAALLEQYRCIPLTFDATQCLELPENELPRDWHAQPASTRALGTRWCEQRSSVLLAVPSAVIPAERIYLMNPRHPDAQRLGIGPPEAFVFDSRLPTR